MDNHQDHEVEESSRSRLMTLLESGINGLTDLQKVDLRHAWQQFSAEELNGDAGVELKPVSEWVNVPIPEPVLWRDATGRYDERVDPVLSVGEVAVLSAPGGTGKSYITLSIAVEAATAHMRSNAHGRACGLCIRSGPVVLIGYEDAPARVADRIKKKTGTVPPDVYIWPNPMPLYAGDPKGRTGEILPCTAWNTLWNLIALIKPSLVVVDPASVALAANLNDAAVVRSFLRGLTAEADRTGCGVLLVAHDTKSGRNEARGGGDPGAGAVAGSSQWFDGARGVLYLHRVGTGPERVLHCLKANYGRSGWGAALEEDFKAGRFVGLVLNAMLEADEIDEAQKGSR